MGGSGSRTPRPLRQSDRLAPSQDGLDGIGVRMCIGCRGHGLRTELLRLVAREGCVRVDEQACAPGRGAWLHRRRACLEQAVRRRAFGRALHMQGTVEVSAVLTWFDAIERVGHRVE